MKHDGYADRSERATFAAVTTPSPCAITSRARTTFSASPARKRAAADSTAAVHETGLRIGLMVSARAARVLTLRGSRSSRSSASAVAAVTNVRPRDRIRARAGTRSSRAGNPDHGPAGSRSGRYAKPPIAIGPAERVESEALSRRQSRAAARRRSLPRSKSTTLPLASSSATPFSAATMSNARPRAATLTASGIGRSTRSTSWPASRAAPTTSTRSGVRSSSHVRTGVVAIIVATPSSKPRFGHQGTDGRISGGGLSHSCTVAVASTSAFFYVLPGRTQQRALEVMADERAACLEQLGEESEQLALGHLGLASLRLDALAHVTVEEVDGLARGAVDVGCVLLAKLHERAKRDAGRDQLHARGDRFEVVGGVPRLVATLDRQQQACLLQAREQGFGDTATVRQLCQGQGLRRRRSGHRLDQPDVRGLELAGQESLDHGEGGPSLVEFPDAAQAVEVGDAVPGHAPIPARR